MAGLFLFFLITIALGELVSDYLKDLNREDNVVSTIRFTKEDKAAIKQFECDASPSNFKREPPRPKVKTVEGDLFK